MHGSESTITEIYSQKMAMYLVDNKLCAFAVCCLGAKQRRKTNDEDENRVHVFQGNLHDVVARAHVNANHAQKMSKGLGHFESLISRHSTIIFVYIVLNICRYTRTQTTKQSPKNHTSQHTTTMTGCKSVIMYPLGEFFKF